MKNLKGGQTSSRPCCGRIEHPSVSHVTPFSLVYAAEVVVFVKITISSSCLALASEILDPIVVFMM